MTERLRVGYLPLLDAALLLVADRVGFARERGLELELVRETSWANIRDKLAVGYFDAAHMLAPAAIACSLGLGQIRAPLVAPISLGLNGNAITVSHAFYKLLSTHADGDMGDPFVSARALVDVVAGKRARGEPLPVFAHVFPFSSHHYQLRIWLKAGGLDPDHDVGMVVLPPPFMVRGLEQGQVDGFCVGAPWNSVAVESNAGVILHLGRDIVRNCPEKVLTMRKEWAIANGSACEALLASIRDAAIWCADGAHRQELSETLYEQVASSTGQDVIARILGGEMRLGNGASRFAPDYLNISPAATSPHREQALWLYAQMVAAGQADFSDEQARDVAAIFPEQTGAMDAAALPVAFAGPSFEPESLKAYAEALV